MSPEEINKIFQQHVQYEFERNLDATMDTLVDDCWYEVNPLGYRMTGKPTVREFYARMFESIIPNIAEPETVEERSVSYGDSHCVFEYRAKMRMPDGSVQLGTSLSVAVLRGDLVEGERLFVDHIYGELWEHALGPDFDSIPGVTRDV